MATVSTLVQTEEVDGFHIMSKAIDTNQNVKYPSEPELTPLEILVYICVCVCAYVLLFWI